MSVDFTRRHLLATTALLLVAGSSARAGVVEGALPWAPNAGSPPEPVRPGPWRFFTGPEGAAVEAIANRIIPPDESTPGGKESGSAVFIDRQLAGPHGQREGLYTRPPFMLGSKTQGPQSADGPAAQYRQALAALDRHCRAALGGRTYAELAASDQDAVLYGLEEGSIELDGGVDGKVFFETILKDVQMGFFADPIYGGNRDMAGWRMIGFPGARYDYRDWVGRHNERFPLPPVSLVGRAEWTERKG